MNKNKGFKRSHRVFDEVYCNDKQQLVTVELVLDFLISNSIVEAIVYHTGS